MEKMIRRLAMFFIGINLLAAGIILNTRSDLGVAAFTSFSYALSKIAGISLGSASVLVYLALIGVQFLLLQKVSVPVLLQIPFSFVFGILTDFYDFIVPEMALSLWLRFLLLAAAIWLTSIGVYLYTNCRLVMTPVEGIVQTIADKWSFKFSLVKNCFDLFMLLLTVSFCLLLRQPVFGIGIGTVLSALILGRMIGIYEKLIGRKG
ncbi:MAG: hypothetical protein K2N87_16430 [Eubacterium sp.]|nr:hypothetical protein [Eubacterium sp.]